MFETLTERLDGALRKLRGQHRISEENTAEALNEVRKVLLDADVNFGVVSLFIDNVRKKAVGQDVITNVAPGQLIIKIIYDELVQLMGSEKSEIKFSSDIPSVIMVAGLQGSGKTTFTGKLANYLKSKGKLPLLVAADTYRPAAIDQLIMLGEQIGVPVFSSRTLTALQIAKHAIPHAKENARDVIIIDTAGRLAIDEVMMNEVADIKSAVKPHEILFVVDSMIGQDAVNTAKAFHDRLDFDGVVLTKLDGDTRGGAALSIRSVVGKPIKFVGTGEKMDALEQFYPDRMASRILGMGDIVSLVEKAQQTFDQKQAEKLQDKLIKAQFTLQDFYEQLQQIKKMGPLSQVMSMIPGAAKLGNLNDVDDKELKYVEAIILSMTKEERNNPAIINGSRRKRIANGSGTTIQEVNKLLTQFTEMQKMMRNFSKGKSIAKMMGQRFGR
ncbi:MAG: signal recognition particle protein [Bacteriovoracaceae bacterium]|nr:signal recognition particle protein [Bacteroidota bacterium]